jgi:hypothetical protein
MGCVGRISDNADGFLLNEFNLIEVLLRYATKNNWAVV